MLMRKKVEIVLLLHYFFRAREISMYVCNPRWVVFCGIFCIEYNLLYLLGGHCLKLGDGGGEIVLTTSLGNGSVNFSVDPVDHVLQVGLSFGVVDSHLVVETLLDRLGEIGLSVHVLGIEGELQVGSSLFLDHGETLRLLLESSNTIDFGASESDLVGLPAFNSLVSDVPVDQIFAIAERNRDRVEYVAVEDAGAQGPSHLWAPHEPFLAEGGDHRTPQQRVWSGVTESALEKLEVVLWNVGHSHLALHMLLLWRWWQWTHVGVWGTWHLKVFPVIESVGGEGGSSNWDSGPQGELESLGEHDRFNSLPIL